MPFNLQVQSTTGQSMQQGADAVAKAIAQYQERKRQREANQGAFDALVQSGQVPAESLAKWNAMNDHPDKQSGYLVQMVSGIAQARQNKLADAQILNYGSEAQLRAAQAAKMARDTANGGDDPTVIDPYVDPVSKQPVAGMGVVRKTGQVQRISGGDIAAPDEFGRYWNGKNFVQLRKDKVDQATALANVDRQNQVASLTQQIAENQAALDKGDDHVGGMFGFGSTPRSQMLAGLQAKRSALLDTGGGAAPAAAAAPVAPAASGAPRIGTKADYDALASGTTYTAPDGSIRRKP